MAETWAVEWPLLSDLAPEAVRELLEIARRGTFAIGEVCSIATTSDSLYLIARGRFGARVTTPTSDSVLLRDEQKRGSVALQRGRVTVVDPGELARRRR